MSRASIASRMDSLVEKYHESGQSQKAFSAAHDITEGKLHYWIQKLTETSNNSAKPVVSNFIPIEVNTKEATSKYILIRCLNGLEIEIPI